ncbi:hypothetical protein EDEG_03513 [Edhazardia aedis USNM 41457]|uniref:Uncharacterized protein n=1 Tax=Edhazardia aedis (strain USNM 41457) TaxID=1003232 RepID=J9DKY3_EDHAE|nr:hypothetical protein EDEG_03513 [Edhazardia aedis USNM 41457]|eukprot:EJW02037.1 hypothetical protein EDEG_03513 [Edhazardia aedis USNM 41457]
MLKNTSLYVLLMIWSLILAVDNNNKYLSQHWGEDEIENWETRVSCILKKDIKIQQNIVDFVENSKKKSFKNCANDKSKNKNINKILKNIGDKIKSNRIFLEKIQNYKCTQKLYHLAYDEKVKTYNFLMELDTKQQSFVENNNLLQEFLIKAEYAFKKAKHNLVNSENFFFYAEDQFRLLSNKLECEINLENENCDEHKNEMKNINNVEQNILFSKEKHNIQMKIEPKLAAQKLNSEYENFYDTIKNYKYNIYPFYNVDQLFRAIDSFFNAEKTWKEARENQYADLELEYENESKEISNLNNFANRIFNRNKAK